MKLDGQNSVIPLLFKMVAPRALIFRPLVKGNEDFGTRLHSRWNFASNPTRKTDSEANRDGADADSPFLLFFSFSVSLKNSSPREKVAKLSSFWD